MNLNSGLRLNDSGVKVICSICSREVDEVVFNRDPVLLRTQIIAICHRESDIFPSPLAELPEGTEIMAFGGSRCST